MSPGKHVLARFREWAQGEFGVTLTTSAITGRMSRKDLAPDLLETLQRIEDFRVETAPNTDEE